MAGSRRLSGDQRDLLAVIFGEHANAIEHVVLVEVHNQHLLLRRVGLEKCFPDTYLADVVPNSAIERGCRCRRAEHGADILFGGDAGPDIFHRRRSQDMTVCRHLTGAGGRH